MTRFPFLWVNGMHTSPNSQPYLLQTHRMNAQLKSFMPRFRNVPLIWTHSIIPLAVVVFPFPNSWPPETKEWTKASSWPHKQLTPDRITRHHSECSKVISQVLFNFELINHAQICVTVLHYCMCAYVCMCVRACICACATSWSEIWSCCGTAAWMEHRF